LESRFRIVSIEVLNGKMHVLLQPKTASARRWMKEMILVFNEISKSIIATELRFADGSILRNDFSNERKDPAIAPELFAPEIPPDYKVTQPGAGKRR
jgi:outer membrane lipoprotein-sorting protein